MSRIELEIPPGDFDAYLFDCDGTIADSMPVHLQAWRRAVEEQGGAFPEDLFYEWAGIPVGRTVELLNARFGYALPVAETARRKEELFDGLRDQVKPVAAVLAEVERHYGRAPLAVVSGSVRASVVRTLSALGILEKFAAIVAAEDSPRGKPYPDPFLRAAHLLAVAPDRCLVFEDAEPGIAAAKAAGMQWVKVPTHAGGVGART